MSQTTYNNLDGTIILSDKFDVSAATQSAEYTPYFNNIDDEYIVTFINLENVKEFHKFTYDSLGLTEGRYLQQFYRVSRNGSTWSDWLDLKRNIDNFPIIDSKDQLFIEIKWVRKGISSIGSIRLLEYQLEGELERNLDESDGDVALLNGQTLIVKPPYIYKVFKIDDIEIISSTGIPSGYSIKYRYSQDSSRTWSQWEPFTKENITTTRINPIRFFQIEYFIENNSGLAVKIQDINLIGDFQNVSKDYFKTNLYGIRECCQSNMAGYYDANGNFVPNVNSNGGGGVSGSGGRCDANGLPIMTEDEKSQLYNPYQQNTAINLLNKISSDAQQIFGHKVIYFVTDPDKKGQDHSLHEFQLYNVVCEGNIKVSIAGNNFPDSQIVMNQFDLSLFESMEAHITKQQFKEIFGPQRRPSKEDFLYFCDVNRMFQVDHAQQFRNFNNSAIYYKLILKKYTQKANVQAGTPEIQNKLDQLTKNTTIDELFGLELAQDKASIANKAQFKPLTKDLIRLDILSEIDKELIENSSTIISKANYDLSSVAQGTPAVKYKNLDPVLKVSDNIGYQIWFNINNYILGETYNFYNHYDSINSIGWKVNLLNDSITITLNTDTYTFDLSGSPVSDVISLDENVWYCYVLNIDQRQRKMQQYIYKRDTDYEEEAANLPNTILREVYKNNIDIVPIQYEIESIGSEILGSDMKLTNVRVFSDVIPASEHNKICNQYIIRDDSKYLVFADNATTRLYLPSFPLFE
jgi:hypothetical protein